jgi:hypothetical protein
MRHLLSVLTVLLFATFSLPAHADTIETVVLTGVSLGLGGVVAGKLTVDKTKGTITGADLDVMDGGMDFTFTNPPLIQGDILGLYSATFISGVHSFVLDFFTASLKTYTGGQISDLSTFNPDYLDILRERPVQVTGGELVITPEPSGLLLLGTGILAFAGAIRRKFLVVDFRK